MADNTEQTRWIVVLFGNLCALFAEVRDVFVAANLFWYPVEGDNESPQAPDVLVVFGRPKGKRGSYRQWEEGGVPVTVAFEVLSPKNTYPEMIDKLAFYEEHGVEEYYVFDPERNRLEVWLRRGEVLIRHRQPHGFASPRLGIRFDLSGPEMVVRYPDGRPFLSFEQLESARKAAERRAEDAQRQADDAQRQADDIRKQADDARKQADDVRHLFARLVELSRKARLGQLSEEEQQELRQLEGEAGTP